MRRALALLAVFLCACGGSGAVKPIPTPVTAKTPTPGFTDRVWRAHLQIKVGGDSAVSFDGETKLHIVEIYGDETPESSWLLSVSSGNETELPDGRILQYSVDVGTTIYKGPGRTYTLSEKENPILGRPSGVARSYSYVLVIDPKAPSTTRYGRIVGTCSFDIAEDHRTGSVACPRLASDDGKTVSFDWSWELI